MGVRNYGWILTILLIFVLMVTGCGANSTVNTPGTTNQDSGSTGGSSVVNTSNSPSSQPAAESEKEVTLKLSHIGNTEEIKQDVGLKMAELVEQKTGGTLKIDVYPSGQLAKDAPTAYRSLSTGTIDLTIESVGFANGLEKDVNILDAKLPIVSTPEEMQELATSKPMQEVYERLRNNHGVRLLSTEYLRPDRIIWTKNKIEKPDDIRGVKIRTPESEPLVQAVAAYGGVPIAVPWTETYTALSQGLAAGVEATLANFEAQKFYEVIQYGSNLQTSAGNVIGISVSEKAWAELSPNQQKALQEAADEAGRMGTEMELSEVDQIKAELESQGVNFTEVDVSGFQENLDKMPYNLEEKGIWTKGLYDAVKSDLGR